MGIGNFLKEHQREMIFAAIFAGIASILIPLFWEPIKKFFVSIKRKVRTLSATKKFERNYRDWLIDKYRFLNVRGIKTRVPILVELEKVFISLKATKPSHRVPVLEAFSRDEFLKKKMWEYETEKMYELKDLFKLPQKAVIIIGSPGSGKTTLLNYLTLKFARKSAKELFEVDDEILPIFINLRDTIRGGFLNINRFSENYKNYINLKNCPGNFFEEKLGQGECILLLDGLDEVANEEERKKVARWVDELATNYSRNIFIATSRPYGYESANLYINFLEVQILDFTPTQVEEFIRYWTKAVEIKARGDESEFTLKEADKKAEDLLKAVKENPKIEILTVNPLLLTIVSLVHGYRATLPKRRVELYEECCDVMLYYWDELKGIAGKLQPLQKRALLQPLAYYLHLNGLREEKREKFIELLGNELPKIRVPKYKTSELLDDIRYRSGMLVETRPDFFGFSHLTFQEFLTAKYVLENNLGNFLTTKKGDKYWLEVMLLYCGMTDATKLLDKLFHDKDDTSHTNLFLVGACLAESLLVSPELGTEITQKLSDICLNENESPESRKKALEILKKLEDFQIVEKAVEKIEREERQVAEVAREIYGKEEVLPLIELLKDKERLVRWKAASVLGKSKIKAAVPHLIKLLKDEEDYVRAGAAHALGEIQAKEAVYALIELLRDRESFVRWRSVDALGKIQAKGAVPSLIELLKDKDSDVRYRAALVLGHIGDESAVESLKLLLDDKEYSPLGQGRVRDSAFNALKEISEKTVAPIYKD